MPVKAVRVSKSAGRKSFRQASEYVSVQVVLGNLLDFISVSATPGVTPAQGVV